MLSNNCSRQLMSVAGSVCKAWPNNTSPLRQVLSHETEENVQASLQKIPAIYREVLVLRFQEELQIDEMAGVLSIPLSTVKSRLYRGLEALRGALQGGAV